MEIQEFVWDFFDQDGQFVADETIKDKDDLISTVENNFGSMGVDIAKQEIFEIIEENFNILAAEHVGTTKASQGRARKAAQAIKRVITDYKKASVAESK